MKNLITINRHGVVFTKAGSRVLMILTIDSNTQMNYFIDEEDFDLVPIEDVDYNYVLNRIEDRKKGRGRVEEYKITKPSPMGLIL